MTTNQQILIETGIMSLRDISQHVNLSFWIPETIIIVVIWPEWMNN
jgi:hypothetical protein